MSLWFRQPCQKLEPLKRHLLLFLISSNSSVDWYRDDYSNWYDEENGSFTLKDKQTVAIVSDIVKLFHSHIGSFKEVT